jgi:ATP-dependent Lhr-like helicase
MHADRHQGVLITTINGQPVAAHPMARFLMDAGFHPGPLGLHLRRIPLPLAHHANDSETESAAGEVQ